VSGKIELLESGLFDGTISSQEKVKLRKRLDALAAKQDLKNSVNSYLNKAQHITTILSNTGFDSKTVAKANELINLGNVAMSAFTAYSSGNVLGAVSVVSSLFGGKGKADPAAQRHRQIMNKLTVIEGKIDTVIDLQIETIKNQYKTLVRLDEISLKIDELHAAEMEKIDELKSETLFNRLTNVSLANRQLGVLETFSIPFKELKQDDDQFLSYSALERFYKRRGHRFENNVEILDSLLNVFSPVLDPSLDLAVYESEGEDEATGINLITDLIKGYKNIIGYLEGYGFLETLINEYSWAPMIDVYELDKRVSTEKLIVHGELGQRTTLYVSSFLINTNLLHRTFQVLEEIHIFFPLQNKNTSAWSDLLALEDLVSSQYHEVTGLTHFKDLLTLVNIALIQQNLLAGDKLLDLIYRRLFVDKVDHESTEYLDIVGVLNSNKLLKANFSKYFIKRQLEKERTVTINGHSTQQKFEFFEYNLFLADTSGRARNRANRTNLRQCFDAHLQDQIVYHEGRWKLDLYPDDRESYLVLPNADVYAQGEIKYRRELLELQNLKAKLIDRISEYELKGYFDTENSLYPNLRFN
ncbi:hypothetical protein HN709_01040, partial [Candidatus Peregrinibacteria bacterium]|nr:hypothetical protein [Candidatus Peregrinibacteria bacterium]